MAGLNIRAVQEQLGHASLKTTLELYTDVLDADREQAAAVLGAEVAAARAAGCKPVADEAPVSTSSPDKVVLLAIRQRGQQK